MRMAAAGMRSEPLTPRVGTIAAGADAIVARLEAIGMRADEIEMRIEPI